MSKIKVLVDSPSDLPLSLAKDYNITVMPIKYTLNGVTYKDKFDQTEDEFYAEIRKTGQIPTTSQITPLEYEEYFREAAKEANEILVITLSGAASGTYQNANLSAQIVSEETGAKFHIFDSRSFSFCYGVMALEAGKMAQDGKSIEEILERLNHILNTQKVYFGVETLDYLKKGGRIKTTTAVIGGMLDIRPLLSIKDGLVVAIDKVKGEKKLLSKIAQCIEEDIKDKPNYKVYILKSDSSAPCDTMKNLLDEKGVKYEKETVAVGPVIGSHAGPGVYGFLVIFD